MRETNNLTAYLGYVLLIFGIPFGAERDPRQATTQAVSIDAHAQLTRQSTEPALNSSVKHSSLGRSAIEDSTAKIYVDARSGLDTNAGSQTQPLQTISRAAKLALDNYRRNISTTVFITAGTYRESIALIGDNRSSNTDITFQASRVGSVIISGADDWADWRPDPTDRRRYTHTWPSQGGACTAPQGSPFLEEIVRRGEIVFVNGNMLIQALSLNEMSEGSFFVDEPRERIYIWPASATNMVNVVIEVSVRPKLLDVHRISNLTLRGLSFVQANTCVSLRPPASVNISGGTNHLIEDCSFQWNNWGGFRLDGVSNSTVRRVIASHNGAVGIVGYRLKNVTYEDVEVSYNNWRGARGHLYGWDVAGAKVMRTHDSTFWAFRAFGNQTRGLWFDTDNANITVQHSYLSGNQVNGLFLEASQGPFTIKDTRICQNSAEGVLTNNAESVSMIGNLIYGNKTAQVFIDGGSKSRSDHNWETLEPYTAVAQKWTLRQNVIVGIGRKQHLFDMYESSSASSSLFVSTLTSDSNTWYNAEDKEVFQLDPGGPNHRPKDLNFEQWRSSTRQDQTSTFATPSIDAAAACARP
jgi:hypothetical protein